jgi:hypothetical protein
MKTSSSLLSLTETEIDSINMKRWQMVINDLHDIFISSYQLSAVHSSILKCGRLDLNITQIILHFRRGLISRSRSAISETDLDVRYFAQITVVWNLNLSFSLSLSLSLGHLTSLSLTSIVDLIEPIFLALRQDFCHLHHSLSSPLANDSHTKGFRYLALSLLSLFAHTAYFYLFFFICYLSLTILSFILMSNTFMFQLTAQRELISLL